MQSANQQSISLQRRMSLEPDACRGIFTNFIRLWRARLPEGRVLKVSAGLPVQLFVLWAKKAACNADPMRLWSVSELAGFSARAISACCTKYVSPQAHGLGNSRPQNVGNKVHAPLERGISSARASQRGRSESMRLWSMATQAGTKKLCGTQTPCAFGARWLRIGDPSHAVWSGALQPGPPCLERGAATRAAVLGTWRCNPGCRAWNRSVAAFSDVPFLERSASGARGDWFSGEGRSGRATTRVARRPTAAHRSCHFYAARAAAAPAAGATAPPPTFSSLLNVLMAGVVSSPSRTITAPTA